MSVQAGTFIMYEEATLTPPDNETQLNELAVAPADSSLGTALAPASASPANSSAAPANAELAPGAKCIDGTTAWMGCVLVNVPAVMGEHCSITSADVLLMLYCASNAAACMVISSRSRVRSRRHHLTPSPNHPLPPLLCRR